MKSIDFLYYITHDISVLIINIIYIVIRSYYYSSEIYNILDSAMSLFIQLMTFINKKIVNNKTKNAHVDHIKRMEDLMKELKEELKELKKNQNDNTEELKKNQNDNTEELKKIQNDNTEKLGEEIKELKDTYIKIYSSGSEKHNSKKKSKRNKNNNSNKKKKNRKRYNK